MKRRSVLGHAVLGGAMMGSGALALAGRAARAAPPASFATNTDHGFNSAGSFEIVAEFADPGPSGIAITPDGRMFVGFPRHAVNHTGATLAELKGGALVPYPDAATSLPSARAPSARLMSVHGMTTDTRGRLWLIDDGKLAGQPLRPGAAKVVGIDPATNRIVASIVLTAPTLLSDSHMNDLRVDLTHGAQGTAYVTDSSFGTHPALVVVDLATGRQRRVLATHPSTQAERGFMTVVEGRPLVFDPHHPTFVSGGVDGITLSPDSATLYYSPLTSRRLYSLPTALLSDFSKTDADLAAAVADLGEKGVADGLATDPQGRIYTTNFEHDAIFRRNPDGTFDTVVRDPRVLSPDGIFVHDGYVYCTLGQWNRLASFNGGHDLRVPPYFLIRCPTDVAAPLSSIGDVRQKIQP
ncbi:major royal jelly protein [Gluconacetobacter diazotrophicus PA1 5]|uniref:Gluconolactonase n=2 Tax=Gluconacetobacter diazotrophicus TaxID=33996 RepID=A0A7W4I4P6_GLUDI|nr:L-dopachrome tautomerase-related protein [Gluconacetobacter diazotrophicus]ACI50941.1 major royal jelly protein [Gluconacetobacter diazotrophicus PA1 5]MBB2156124.1 gluconolactonase [Gluconacetobacter diazotrophicus]TWB08604.1 major royal jelly protein [Gluconacetobacter diazotrophicus]CAP54804.1 putative major royal jelly-like protein [Gluconacetobacter diazotrophicus PA1 5]